jgi:hypothetical protein
LELTLLERKREGELLLVIYGQENGLLFK